MMPLKSFRKEGARLSGVTISKVTTVISLPLNILIPLLTTMADVDEAVLHIP